MDQVVCLSTAAGPEKCSEVFDYINQDSGEEVVALILPDTPTVLAMGIAVIDLGWHFEWPARSYFPFAIKPDGTMVWFVVRDYVIYFSKNQDAAFMNRGSATVAAAKRRHAAEGPPLEADEPAGEDLATGSSPPLLTPPPIEALEGASELMRERARKRRNI